MNHNTNIVVNLQVEGFHCWPGAFEKVSYLQDRHRHIFFLQCKKNVNDTIDRNIEIIEFKRAISTFLRDSFSNKFEENSPCEFGSLSCENIARLVAEVFDLDSCQVLEENENGSEVTKSVIKNINPICNKSLYFVVGQAGSGKSTIAKRESELNERKSYVYEFGDIVREITNTEKRVHKNTIDTAIVKEAMKIIDAISAPFEDSDIYLVGPRTMAVFLSLTHYARSKGFEIHVIWLDYDYDIIKERFENRRDKKDSLLDFDDILRLDNKLGLGALTDYLQTANATNLTNLFQVHNYTP